jgi:cellulose 1,4-beta-cellobiosidase
MESVAYAIQKLGLPNVSLYLDAAHAGWLGWDGNRERAAKIFKKVLKMAGGVDTIRGFATNTSNYTHLYNRDGMFMEPTDPCFNELIYVKKLAGMLSDHGIRQRVHRRYWAQWQGRDPQSVGTLVQHQGRWLGRAAAGGAGTLHRCLLLVQNAGRIGRDVRPEGAPFRCRVCVQ